MFIDTEVKYEDEFNVRIFDKENWYTISAERRMNLSISCKVVAH